MHVYAFLLQGFREFRWGPVIASHSKSLEFEIPGDGRHTYAAYAYEIYVSVPHLPVIE